MSMYSARVPDSVEDEVFAAAEFDSLRREDESWDIAAFSKISVVTNGGADENKEADNAFDASFETDFPDSFGFPITAAEEEQELKEASVVEEETVPDVKEEPKRVAEEVKKEEEHEIEESESEESVDEEPEANIDPELDIFPDEESVRSASSPEYESDRTVSSSEECLDAHAHMILMTSRSESTCGDSEAGSESNQDERVVTATQEEERPTHTAAISDVSDVWNNVVDAVISTSDAVKSTSQDIVTAMEEDPPPRKAGRAPPTVASSADSVPSVTSSSVGDSSSDSEDDDDDDHPIKKTLSNLSQGTSGSKSASSRILNFFGKRHRRSGSKGSSVKSSDKPKFVSSKGSAKSISSSKDKSSTTTITSKDKKTKIKLLKGAVLQNIDKSEPKATRTNYDIIDISDEDNVVDAKQEPSPGRHTRVYKIMRKKPRSPMNNSFIEELAEEFFTCSYFFKCLGDAAVSTGEDTKTRATSCCRGEGCCVLASACVDEDGVDMDEAVEESREPDSSNVAQSSRFSFLRTEAS